MIDEQQIRLWWSIFRPDNSIEEIRLLGAGTMSGYFTDVETLIREVSRFENHPKFSVYFIMNRITQGCAFRSQQNQIERVERGETTKDEHIIHRDWLLIDIDPNKIVDGIKISNINSTDEELDSARKVARSVCDYLFGKGFPMPITAMSGNGIHLYFKIDEPNDSDTQQLIDNFLHSLGQKFTTEKAEVDLVVGNAGNLSKLYGTVPHKGADIAPRRCRMARIEYVPKEIVCVSRELIQKVADEYVDPAKKKREQRELQRQNKNYQITDFPDISLEDFLNNNGIEYKAPVYDSSAGAMRYDLIHCPWEDEHSTPSAPGHAAIWEYPSGEKAFHCFHGHCADREWEDVWKLFDPNLYKDAWKEQRQQLQQQTPISMTVASIGQQSLVHEEPEVAIDEDAEKGKKWLFTSEIEMFDPSKFTIISSGFDKLDAKIRGLALGEVTLLSGGNSAGKSSWINTLIVNSIEQKYPVALWSRELPASKESYWLNCVAAGPYNVRDKMNGTGDVYVDPVAKKKIDKWLEGKFYLYNNAYPPRWNQLAQDLLEPIKKGCKLVILDNLFALQISDFGKDKYDNQTDLILALCDMAKKYQIHILLVAHPRKITGYIRKVDISGTSDLTNAVDNVLILHRNNEDFKRAYDEFYKSSDSKKKDFHASDKFEGYDGVMEIAKNRSFGAVDVIFGLNYEPKSRRFLNYDGEVKKYSWEEPPTQVQIEFSTSDTNMPFARSTDEDAPF